MSNTIVKLFSREDLKKDGTLKKKNNALLMSQEQFKEYVSKENLTLSKGYIDNVGYTSNEKLFTCSFRGLIIGVTGTIEYVEQKTHWAVIRLEAKDDEDEKMIEMLEGFEISIDEADQYLRELGEKKILVNSGYVGNAYFLETTNKEAITKFHKIIQDNLLMDEFKGKAVVNIEWNYYPDWADEIIKQSEDEDKEDNKEDNKED